MGMAALQRGYNVITYEGPGQPTPRREQNLGFIVEWKKVVTPIIDYLVTLPGVDPETIALVGFSFGGFLAPRAAAFEHRLAALLAIDGLYDFGSVFLTQLPANLTKLFESGNVTAFDKGMEEIVNSPSTPTQLRWIFEQGEWPFDTTSARDS
jgi:alpha-beta hydrolase superfamily lysophospholipase